MEVNIDETGLITVASFHISGSKEWHILDKTTSLFLTRSPDGSKFLFNLPEEDFVSHTL
ncbi:MAG: hypothetical protein J7J61_09955 [Candidatus Hydrothermae bacterium]|nr:hypothetical protein [Candidatus Hydrothermae bacterium]